MSPQELEKMVFEMHNDVREIKDVLMGNKMGSIGMAERMVNNEKRITNVNEKIDLHTKSCDAKENKRKGIITVLLFLWSAALWAVGHFL